jgi:hypothetical protein
MASDSQNYDNHRQLVPAFHYVFFGVLVATLVGTR